MITRPEIDKINGLRRLLLKISNRAESKGRRFENGKLDEACEAAERSLSNVLIVGLIYAGADVKESDFEI